ncbi:MAG: N-6 DNA methylase [Candidatus Methanofastidiosia archaeon]
MWEKIREENLNVMLAELLAKSGLKAIGEPIIKRKPDVLVHINGIRVIIEGKYPGNRKNLYKKAYERIDEGLCEAVMMVEYVNLKKDIQEQIYLDQKEIKKILKHSSFNVGIVTYVDRVSHHVPELVGGKISPKFMEKIDFKELVAFLIQTYDSIIKENVLDNILENMEEKISQFSEKIMMDEPNIERLKEVLELHEKEKIKSKDKLKILATSAILVMDAMIFQEVLARKNTAINTLSYIQSCENTKKELEDSWDYILEDNYEPIFEIAKDLLKTLPASHNTNEGLKDLAHISYNIASSPILLKHDLFGRIYHKLLLGNLVKYYATLYTSLPAARLLARLLVCLPPPIDDITTIKVVDFACGSGTLLSAIYKELELKHMVELGNIAIDKFHKSMVEEVLYGFDVLQHATHLTMTTLSLHNPFPIDNSRIYTLKLGVESNEYHTGSIQFLTTSELKTNDLLTRKETGSVKVTRTGKKVTGVTIPSFDICIMNPPFTRSTIGNLLFGGLSNPERRKLQLYLGKILKDQGLTGIGQAGSAAIFFFVADKHITPGGRLGIVVPRSVLSGTSWKKVRKKLQEEYHVEYIITSFEGDNNQWNFSENTSLSEVLIVARKLLEDNPPKEDEPPNYTIFVNLWKKPTNEIESISIGTQLLEMYKNPKLFDISNSNASTFSLRLWGKKIGESYSRILEDLEFGCNSFFAQPELNRVLALLRNEIVYSPKEGIMGRVPLCPLSEIINDLGHDCGYISKTFEMDELGVYKGFWGQRSEEVTTILQEPNTIISPTNKKAARRIWEHNSNLLLSYRSWLPKNRMLSVYISEPVVSSMWWSVPAPDKQSKILALWFNSTYGFLLLLSAAEVTRGPWIEFKKGNKKENSGLWGVPVLDLNKMSAQQKKELLKLYDQVSLQVIKSFPEEYSNPGIKKQIDDKLNEILGIKVDLSDIYEMISRDPMIRGSSLG